MSKIPFLLAGLSLASTGLFAQDTDAVKRLQNTLQEWVSVEKTLSEEVNSWVIEQQLINDSLNVLRTQQATFEERKAVAEETSSRAESDRRALAEDRDSLAAVSTLMEERVRTFEAEMRSLVLLLPEPLAQEVSPVFRRIPANPDDTTLGLAVRTQNLVAILSQIDRFNTTVTRVSEVRELEGGPREVTTLYFGLGAAYFVDQTGDYAGYGRPGANGWVWTTDRSLANSLRTLVAVYDGTREAQFVALPHAID
jgi:hypothetical protein